MVRLCLQVPRTDACLVIGEFFAFLGTALMYFGLTFLCIILGALGRDVPAAGIVLAALACSVISRDICPPFIEFARIADGAACVARVAVSEAIINIKL